MSSRELSDAEFAALMRGKLGKLGIRPPRRSESWLALLSLSLDNVDEMIMAAELDGIVTLLSRGDAANEFTSKFAICTKRLSKDLRMEDVIVERQVKRVVHARAGVAVQDVGWWIIDPDINSQPRVIVHFHASRYMDVIKMMQVARFEPHGALLQWMASLEDHPLLEQCLYPSWRRLGLLNKMSWQVVAIEASASVLEAANASSLFAGSVELCEATDGDDDRATITLGKRWHWIDYDGKLATPWGPIDCANHPAGLVMPHALEEDRIKRILEAQKVKIEVPLAL